MKPWFEVRDLYLPRAPHFTLHVEHLSLERGEVLAIVGPNGCGKSTLLLALAHILKPVQGEIRLNGHLPANDLAYRRQIALVLQDALLLNTSVWNNVTLGLRFRGLPRPEVRRRAEYWLERLGIRHLAHWPATKLSGGEAQRVSLARALALEPALLLLDEPFAALDAPTRERLYTDLQAIWRETQTTTLLVTHDLNEARRLGTRLGIMLAGRIVQMGAPEEVLARAAGEQVGAYLKHSHPKRAFNP